MSQNLLNPSDATLSKTQKLAIAKSNSKINIWSGAVRAGKSYSATLRFGIEIAEAPPGEMAIICRDTNAFRRNVLPIMRSLFGDDVVYSANPPLVKMWGRNIHVIGCNDQRAEGKIRGCTLQAALVDEATVIPESSWMILTQRVAMNNGRIFATTNPDSSLHWLKTNFIDNNPDVTTFYFTMYDNPKLTKDEREFLERQHKGVYYRRFIAGEWCLAEGAVFDFFDEQIHVINKPPANAKYYIVGVDIGFSNPTAFVLIGYNDDVSPSLWVEQEYYYDYKARGMSKTDSDYVQDLSNFISQRHNVKFVYVDPAALSFKIEARRWDLGAPIRDADNDVLNGIRSLSAFLANGDLKIMRNCKNLIKELQSYCWDSKKSEKGEDAPIKRADHLIDALRYGVYSCYGNRSSLKGSSTDIETKTLGHNQIKQQLGSNLNFRPNYRFN